MTPHTPWRRGRPSSRGRGLQGRDRSAAQGPPTHEQPGAPPRHPQGTTAFANGTTFHPGTRPHTQRISRICPLPLLPPQFRPPSPPFRLLTGLLAPVLVPFPHPFHPPRDSQSDLCTTDLTDPSRLRTRLRLPIASQDGVQAPHEPKHLGVWSAGPGRPVSPPAWLWFSRSSARTASRELRDLRW